MTQLDPELRRLIQWSRAEDEPSTSEAPFGVASRIAGHWRETAEPAEPVWWPRFQLATAWLSLAILIAGGTIWAIRLRTAVSAYDFAPAYQRIAQNIAP